MPRPPAALHYGFGATPFGPAIALFAGGGLYGLGFGRGSRTGRAALLADYQKRWPVRFLRDDAAAEKILAGVFAGNAPPLHLAGTDWQIAVWREVLKIPPGETVTYGDLAKRLGRPGAARAVGRAVGANPIAWAVPCHRVVGARGAPAGYHWGLGVKAALLAAEGAGLPI